MFTMPIYKMKQMPHRIDLTLPLTWMIFTNFYQLFSTHLLFQNGKLQMANEMQNKRLRIRQTNEQITAHEITAN